MLDPAAWENIGVVGILLATAAAHGIAYYKRWIVPAGHHKEIVEGRDREIAARDRENEALRTRQQSDADALRALSNALEERDAIATIIERALDARGNQGRT